LRILHTADWHAGKKLGRVDRTSEFEEVFDEVVEIASDQKVDLTIVSGDLFDRANAPLESLALVVDTLTRLADASGNVLAIAGNHDSSAMFEFLAPLLEGRGIRLVGKLRRPEHGGVLDFASADGKEVASVACFPFLHETEVVSDFFEAPSEWHKEYADKVRRIGQALCEGIDPKKVGILAGHFFVDGSELGGGERTIHVGAQYATTTQAIPPNIHYGALGHIHRPQAVSGAAVTTRYAGSLLQLDFSERSHNKEVVIVEAQPGVPAKVKSIQLSSGRKLLRVTDDLESLKKRVDEFGDAYLDVRVETGGPVVGLADQVREFLPNALLVQAVYEREDSEVTEIAISERSIRDLFEDYFRVQHGAEADPALLDIVAELEEEVARAAT
jgi:exonuclease SbcD